MARATFAPPQPAQRAGHAFDVFQTQAGVSRLIDELYRLCPLLDGRLIENEVLTAHTANDISHKLGRDVRGWLVVRDTAPICSCRAYLDTAQNISNTTDTKVLIDTVSFDWGSDFDVTTGNRFVAPVNGVYRFSGAVAYTGLADTNLARCFVAKNGSEISAGTRTSQGAASAVDLVVSDSTRMSAGDYLELWTWYSGGATEDLRLSVSRNFLEIELTKDLFDGQTETDVEPATTLRLYSACARTVTLWVF